MLIRKHGVNLQVEQPPQPRSTLASLDTTSTVSRAFAPRMMVTSMTTATVCSLMPEDSMVGLLALKQLLLMLHLKSTVPASATQSEIKKASRVVTTGRKSTLTFCIKTTRSLVLITSPVMKVQLTTTSFPIMASRKSFLGPRDKMKMQFLELILRQTVVSGSLVMTRTMVCAGLSETPLISTSSTLNTRNTRTTQDSNWQAQRPWQLVASSLSRQYWCEPLSSRERHSESTNDSLFEKLFSVCLLY